MKVRIIRTSTEPLDECRAAQLAKYVMSAWEAPITEGNFFQALAFLWVLAAYEERRQGFWKHGNQRPN
jgi:hypothetical protein